MQAVRITRIARCPRINGLRFKTDCREVKVLKKKVLKKKPVQEDCGYDEYRGYSSPEQCFVKFKGPTPEGLEGPSELYG